MLEMHIAKLQAGAMMGGAWTKAISVDVNFCGINGVRIFPLNSSIIAEQLYSVL
jgi:hypothetical protein